jgi:hypothetical protein
MAERAGGVDGTGRCLRPMTAVLRGAALIAVAAFLIAIDTILMRIVSEPIVLAWLAAGELTEIWSIAGNAVIFVATIVLIGRERRHPRAVAGRPS